MTALPVLTKTERAVNTGTTIYGKAVKVAPPTPTKSTGLKVLKPAKVNKKLSGRSMKRITKGPKTFRGKHLYNLTLTERETCPATCEQWGHCYGNRMPFATRYVEGEHLQHALVDDLEFLNKKHPEGFVVRLHILGDFYSVEYVKFWESQLEKYENLCVYGYTHRRYGMPIGTAVSDMVQRFPNRASILRSDGKDPRDPLARALTVVSEDKVVDGIVICPEQTHDNITCMSCGLCFHGNISVQFLEHSWRVTKGEV